MTPSGKKQQNMPTAAVVAIPTGVDPTLLPRPAMAVNANDWLFPTSAHSSDAAFGVFLHVFTVVMMLIMTMEVMRGRYHVL